MSNFDFLTSEWKDIHEAASKAESAAIPDPRTSCFYARPAWRSGIGESVWSLTTAVKRLNSSEIPAFSHFVCELPA